MNSDMLTFADEPMSEQLPYPSDEWKILIVDDEESVHIITKLALKNMRFDDKPLHFFSAHSSKEAKDILAKQHDISIILLDVVMEEKNSGLQLVEHVRKTLHNETIRIIIRTGQPGSAPERYVIEHYDINDYKEKTELTTERLFTTIRTALAQYHQIITLQEQKVQLYKQMIHDPLTKLKNRYQLNLDINNRDTKSLILINIDSFGMLNDSYGFSFGDKTLVEFTKILQQNFEHSTLYRLEGDLFSILLHEVKENVLGRIAQLNAFLAHHTLHIDNIEIRLNITIGVVIDEESNLIQKADIASRQARTISRNRTQLYDKELSIIKKMQNNTQWSKIILQAIESDNLLAYFQPIVENSTGKIVKYETLVRLKHHSTIHTPFDFLQTARYAGLLTHITRRMLDKACSQFSNTDYIFSVNITDHDLQDPELIPYVTRLLKKYHIKPKQLIFELLEQSSIAQIPNATAQLKALHQLGCPISIDDFGVECSNFAQLFSYDLESIKIDGSFIKNIHESHDCQLIVESILFFAKRAGIKTVAEYVHSKEVYEKVLALGIDYSQGYYFGKPQPTLL